MYTREQFWQSIQSEIRIIKHLATKVSKEIGDYRPSPAQRSTLELMQYLSATGSTTTKVMLTENTKSGEDYTAFKEGVTLENFADKMDAQEQEMKEMFDKMSDEDLKKEFDYYGLRSKAEHLFENTLKGFAAYRMQLFLYIKACGVAVNTYNVWVGMDDPSKDLG